MRNTTTIALCDCGQPLHYVSPASERAMREMIDKLGETVVVMVPDAGTFRVPRHYIALHGLAAVDLAAKANKYGWQRVD